MTTIPAGANVGVALAFGEWSEAAARSGLPVGRSSHAPGEGDRTGPPPVG